MTTRSALFPACSVLVLAALPALADAPRILSASAASETHGWRVEVTLLHPDMGWDHYANAWQVETAEGTVIATRELQHPHVDEQPFTRDMDGVMIPEGTDHIVIRARCSLDGWGASTLEVPLR